MRKLDTNDFEQANIEYVEFWLLDPFIYTNKKADASDYGGDFYFINLGEVSEDVLRDGKKLHMKAECPLMVPAGYTALHNGERFQLEML